MDWARTLRIDALPADTLQRRLTALARDGVRVRTAAARELPRTYALIEGPQGVDPAELAQALPDARWYDAAIIALAIELQPPDALPAIADALGGSGGPAGVLACDAHGTRLVVEFRPDTSPAHLILRIVDVELRRFAGTRRTQLLTPLAMDAAAAIAAAGLQAPEIASDRILEPLLGLERVE